MKYSLIFLCILISFVSPSTIPSLSSAFDYITQQFSCFYVSAYILNYTEGYFRMNQNKFLQPLSENITKTEDTLSLTINNIVISLVSTFRFKHNNMTNVILFQDVFIQYNIDTLGLTKRQESGIITISKLEISRPFISKQIELMTAHSFKEFQLDKDDQLYNTLKVMLEGHLQDFLNEFNLNFQFQTILSYALEDAGIVKFPYLQYTIKYLSYEEAQFINTGNSIRVELYTYVTFTKVEDHSIVTARCDLIEFKNQQFTIGKFEIIKPETESIDEKIKEDFTFIIHEASKKFFDKYEL